MSFEKDKIIGNGLTFDDVLLVPAYSEILPRDVDLSSRFSRNISLNAPLISAAMDTVTESETAIAIAREGGMGVIHKNMSLKEQLSHVRKVKRAESVMIHEPVTIHGDATVKDALDIMEDFKIGGIPVVDHNGKLEGILTNRDLRFEFDMKREVSEIMTSEHIITTTKKTGLDEAAKILKKYKIEKLPVVDAHNKLIGLITYKDITRSKDRPNACKDSRGRLRVAAAIGTGAGVIDDVEHLLESGVDAVVIDTAHGHSLKVIETLKLVKKHFGKVELDVMVGNIGTGEAAKTLVDAGADAVKVGIGPGSICTTRVIAGVGIPQLSAIYDVAKAIKGSGVTVVADGGLRYSGDIVKAIAAGADAVMAGSLFAGVEESPGETIIYNGRKYKSYRGMGSVEAMQKGSNERYFQDRQDEIRKMVPEGIAARVPYKGMLSEVIYQLLGGLRAGMGYCGAANIQQLMQAGFIRITNAGVLEGHPHDVTITREAPNYSR